MSKCVENINFKVLSIIWYNALDYSTLLYKELVICLLFLNMYNKSKIKE
jgi:hypothetical protein